MMKENDVVKADFPVLIIMFFERWGGGGILRNFNEGSLIWSIFLFKVLT
jgi:hypothetical protein